MGVQILNKTQQTDMVSETWLVKHGQSHQGEEAVDDKQKNVQFSLTFRCG